MVLDLSLGRSAQPYLGEIEFHSSVEMCFSASQEASSCQTVAESPRAAASSFVEGRVFQPMKAFGKSILTFFLDFDGESTPDSPSAIATV